MTPEQLAQQAFELGPDALLQMLQALDEALQSEAQVSLQDLVDQLDGGQGQEEDMAGDGMNQGDDVNTFAPDQEAAMAAAGQGGRIFMR